MSYSRFTVFLKKEAGFERVNDRICNIFVGENWVVDRVSRTDYIIIVPRTLFSKKHDFTVEVMKIITSKVYRDRLIITDNSEK